LKVGEELLHLMTRQGYHLDHLSQMVVLLRVVVLLLLKLLPVVPHLH
jgi:hypothetical protein